MAKYCLILSGVLICAGCTTDWQLQIVDAQTHLPLRDVSVDFWARSPNMLNNCKTYLAATYRSDDLGRVQIGSIPSDAICNINIDHAGYFHLLAHAGPGKRHCGVVWLIYSVLPTASQPSIEEGEQDIPFRMPLVIPIRRLLGTTKPASE